MEAEDFKNDQSLLRLIEHRTSTTPLKKPFTSVDNNRRPENRISESSYGSSLSSLQESVDQPLDKYYINPNNPGVVLIINQEEFFTEIKPEYRV